MRHGTGEKVSKMNTGVSEGLKRGRRGVRRLGFEGVGSGRNICVSVKISKGGIWDI